MTFKIRLSKALEFPPFSLESSIVGGSGCHVMTLQTICREAHMERNCGLLHTAPAKLQMTKASADINILILTEPDKTQLSHAQMTEIVR